MSAQPYGHLLAPGRIGSMELRNRIVMSPMETMYGTPGGLPSERTIAYFAARAAGGVGLVTVGATGIDPQHPETPGGLQIGSDAAVEAHRALVDAVHEHGARIQPQIVHAGPDGLGPEIHGVTALGPSVIPSYLTGRPSAEATKDQIAEILDQFRAASVRVRAAGYDGLELHAAHGYMFLGSFLAPQRNRRGDRYRGTSVEGRIRVVLEALAAIRGEVGDDFPITLRISGSATTTCGTRAPGGRRGWWAGGPGGGTRRRRGPRRRTAGAGGDARRRARRRLDGPPGEPELPRLAPRGGDPVGRRRAARRLGDREALAALAPDAIVVATGGKVVVPDVAGAALAHVTVGLDPDRLPAGRRVVVVGGRLAAVEYAETLAARGRLVALLEAGPEIATEFGAKRRTEHFDRLDRLGVTVHVECVVEEITPDGVRYMPAHGTSRVLPADAVVLAGTVVPDASLVAAIADRLPAVAVHTIGDAALGLGLIRGATATAARAVQDIA